MDRTRARPARVGTLKITVCAPEIELLWWEGCPSTERALIELREALGDVGLEGAEVRMREIRTDDDAREAGFKGSPTILIDGTDLLETTAATATAAAIETATAAATTETATAATAATPATAPEPAALTCRVYRRRDGRISPTPDPEDVRDALRLATRAVNR